jgi:hypothetical protein
MKLIIELTNGKDGACGDCEVVADMLAGESVQTWNMNLIIKCQFIILRNKL